MAKGIFWGERGEYGPFPMQEDGWPNAGEVIRHYRRIKRMKAEELARCYGKAIGTQLTARWILKMEQQNKVPTDITRRRALIKILNIPPKLLGLSSLEQITDSHTVEKLAISTFIPAHLDLEWYDKEVRIFWKLHYAQTAQDILVDLLAHIHKLASAQQTAKGSLKRHTSELMNSYYRLAATIQRDHGNFEAAYTFANEAVRLAKEMGNDLYALQLTAASQYTRGVIYLAWGAFGNDVKQGKVSLHKKKLEAALTDFGRALKYASPQLKGILYSEMARAKALASPLPVDITIALRLLEQAETFVDLENNNDFYSQILLNGDMKGLDKRRLILGRAKTFLAIKRPAKVLDEIAALEWLKEGQSHTRRKGWTHILSAYAAIDLGDYAAATLEALRAFNDCKEAYSIAHLARVNTLHAWLLASPYRSNTEVRRLGRLLGTVFPSKELS